jgi:hypothetical protein
MRVRFGYEMMTRAGGSWADTLDRRALGPAPRAAACAAPGRDIGSAEYAAAKTVFIEEVLAKAL